MKKIVAICAAGMILIYSLSGDTKTKVSDCACNGIRLFGRVQVVDRFPDLRVRVVSSFEDIRVRKVDSFPDRCGKWQFVDSFPDFTIQYVAIGADIRVKFVESFPGVK